MTESTTATLITSAALIAVAVINRKPITPPEAVAPEAVAPKQDGGLPVKARETSGGKVWLKRRESLRSTGLLVLMTGYTFWLLASGTPQTTTNPFSVLGIAFLAANIFHYLISTINGWTDYYFLTRKV